MQKSETALQTKSLLERIFHAVMFEVIAISICAPVGAMLLNKPIWQMGTLAILLSTIAMIWNIIYNASFDRFWPTERVTRTFKVRIAHASGFECGFIVFSVTMAAFVLNITLTQALLLEIGFFLFFLPYTVIYNWSYDTLREKVIILKTN